jgi:UDP-N-acetylglucosamine 4-epimerase
LEIETPNDLVNYLKEYLAKYDPAIADAEVAYGPNRAGRYSILWQYR